MENFSRAPQASALSRLRHAPWVSISNKSNRFAGILEQGYFSLGSRRNGHAIGYSISCPVYKTSGSDTVWRNFNRSSRQIAWGDMPLETQLTFVGLADKPLNVTRPGVHNRERQCRHVPFLAHAGRQFEEHDLMFAII